jgi:hypothetical protein
VPAPPGPSAGLPKASTRGANACRNWLEDTGRTFLGECALSRRVGKVGLVVAIVVAIGVTPFSLASAQLRATGVSDKCAPTLQFRGVKFLGTTGLRALALTRPLGMCRRIGCGAEGGSVRVWKIRGVHARVAVGRKVLSDDEIRIYVAKDRCGGWTEWPPQSVMRCLRASR